MIVLAQFSPTSPLPIIPHTNPHRSQLFLIGPHRSGHFASGELATIFGNTGNSWNLSETEIGVQRPSLHWQTLMHSESLQLFRSHGETRGAVKTYQKSVPIILIFVAIVFDGPFSCQNIFFDLIVLVSGVYDIFCIFAGTKIYGYESGNLCKSKHQHPRL